MSSTLAPGKQWTAALLPWELSESPRMIESPITTVETGDGSVITTTLLQSMLHKVLLEASFRC